MQQQRGLLTQPKGAGMGRGLDKHLGIGPIHVSSSRIRACVGRIRACVGWQLPVCMVEQMVSWLCSLPDGGASNKGTGQNSADERQICSSVTAPLYHSAASMQWEIFPRLHARHWCASANVAMVTATKDGCTQLLNYTQPA